jgi:hypothetical protein
MKKLALVDEHGTNLLAPKITPLTHKLIALSDSLPDGRVMGVAAVLDTLKAGDSSVRFCMKQPQMAGRSIYIGGRLYICNPATFKAYNEKT